jgi:heme/copper-type cytochrome/quinol oxidase subunit 3
MAQTQGVSSLEQIAQSEAHKGAVATSPISGEPEEEIHLPGPSWLPVLLALGLLVLGVGLVLNIVAAIIGAVFTSFVIAIWARPRMAVMDVPLETATEAAEHGDHAATASSLNWWGMLTFLLTEAVLFVYLISAYLYVRYVIAPQWPPQGVEGLDIVLPSIGTALLLASSFPMHWASAGIRKGNQRQLVLGLAATIGIGVVFLCLQVYEYFHVSFTPSSHVFGSVFFTLTGFHGAHVLIGLVMLGFVLWHATRGRYTAQEHFGVTAGEMYWHFVDVVWIVLFVMLYLI